MVPAAALEHPTERPTVLWPRLLVEQTGPTLARSQQVDVSVTRSGRVKHARCYRRMPSVIALARRISIRLWPRSCPLPNAMNSWRSPEHAPGRQIEGPGVLPSRRKGRAGRLVDAGAEEGWPTADAQEDWRTAVAQEGSAPGFSRMSDVLPREDLNLDCRSQSPMSCLIRRRGKAGNAIRIRG